MPQRRPAHQNLPRAAAWPIFALAGAISAFAPLNAIGAEINFTRDVEPILKAHCLDCHGPDKQKSKFRIDRRSLLLAGGVITPHGDYDSSMQLLETELFDKAGFKHLHVAGHPEGNKDIDPDGSMKNVEAALHWKQAFSQRTGAQMALATQFAFEAGPIIEWANAINDAGIDIPIHIGIAGPAKLQTMIKFAIACGVGPSLKVLQKRAMDVTKLLLPYEPTEVLTQLAQHKAKNPDFNITNVHIFPLGGIKTSATWVTEHGGKSGIPAQIVEG